MPEITPRIEWLANNLCDLLDEMVAISKAAPYPERVQEMLAELHKNANELADLLDI